MKQKEDKDLVKWKARFRLASANQSTLFDDISRWYDNFYSVFDDNIAPWRSKVLDPKVASKCLAIIAKTSLYEPEPNLLPRDEHDFIKAKNNKALLDFQMQNPDFSNPLYFKRYSVLCDAVIGGVGFALLPWKKVKKTYKSRILDKNGKVDLTKEKETDMSLSFNDFIPWSVFRVFLEPDCQSVKEARWIILQDFKSNKELDKLKEQLNINVKIDKDTKDSEGDSYPDSREDSRNKLLSNTKDSGTKKHELWICYDKELNEFTYIVDKDKNIGKEKNIYWHNTMGLVPFYIRPRAFSPWGDGIFERVERLGSANNSLINHFLDQLDISLNGVVLRTEGTNVDYDIRPGGEVVYNGMVKPEVWSIPQPDANGFQLARQVVNEAIEENTISQYEVGVPRSATDKTQGTKGGIEAIQDAASDMVRFFKRSYAESCKEWFRIWMSNNQQFVDRDMYIRINGNNGQFPKKISPEEIMTTGVIDIEVDADTMEVKSKEFQKQMKLAYVDRQLAIATQAAQMQSPINVNYYELSKMIAEQMGVDKEFDNILTPIPQQNYSPSKENELFLMGREQEPNINENHDLHITVHNDLLEDTGIDKSIQDNVIAHIQAHNEMKQQLEQQKQQQADMQALQDTQAIRQSNEQVASLRGRELLPQLQTKGNNINELLSNVNQGQTQQQQG
ncbi:MAG: hypothetical protein BWY74_00348 [Firmicutes bacterium ADurb.Bin419]|nr:MAG: hypothetical protein BWY74_00348 [Firmicutes bacterium ADurb.Bin419]